MRLRVRTQRGDSVIEHAAGTELARENFWGLVTPTLARMQESKTGRFLEIGSRGRSGITRGDVFAFPGWDYVGFDIMAGDNVDVVGDAHELSQHFPCNHFDGVAAFAVLEHILMPWKLMLELNKVMKMGAIGVFVTHQAYPLHDAPWDFWRFSDRAWAGLMNPATGFEIIETKMSEPAYLVSRWAHAGVDHGDYEAFQASSVAFRKIANTALSWNVSVADCTGTHYPGT